MMNEFYDRLKKSFEQKPHAAKRKQKGDKIRKTELTPYQQWSRSFKLGTAQSKQTMQTEIKSREPPTVKQLPVFTRKPLHDMKNTVSMQTRNMASLIQQRRAPRKRNTGRMYEKIHFVSLPGKENSMPENGMVPMLAIPLGPVTNSPHVNPIYQIQRQPSLPGQMPSLPILHPINSPPNINYQDLFCDFSSEPLLPPCFQSNDMEFDDNSLSELFPSIEEWDYQKLDELIEEAEAADAEETSFHTLPDALNTSLANALNLSIKEEPFDDNFLPFSPKIKEERFILPQLYDNPSTTQDSAVIPIANLPKSIPHHREIYVSPPKNAEIDIPKDRIVSHGTPTKTLFSDYVMESNGKIYAESSNIRKSFSRMLIDDSEPMLYDTSDVDLTSSDSNSESNDAPLMDPDLAYTISESYMVANIGHTSFYDVVYSGDNILKEETKLAKKFLEVFENVERLVIDNRQSKKALCEKISDIERECEVVFNGQEPWLNEDDLKNETEEINLKSDLVYRVHEVETDTETRKDCVAEEAGVC